MGSHYIAAYGSNLDEKRMKERCPSASVVGTSLLKGYRLLFKQSYSGAYATIEQDANCTVPVLVYAINTEDEKKLDRFEGFPNYYYKKEYFLPVKKIGRKSERNLLCTAYIMHEYRILSAPSKNYFGLIDMAYMKLGFDPLLLFKAIEDTIGKDRAIEWIADYL